MCSSLFIEDVLLNEQKVNILIENNRITGIGSKLQMPVSAYHIKATNMAVFPSFANGHTHAAMTLFRGFGDDKPLDEWLNQWIWPNEKNLDDEIVYWGTRLACVEMIKSGTTAFNDMYFYLPAAARAVEDSGIRAMLGYSVFDFFNADIAKKMKYDVEEWAKTQNELQSELITTAIAPHAPYTVSASSLKWLADFADEHKLKYHIHMSETTKEVGDIIKQYGKRPYVLLESIGVLDRLGENFIGAHSLHLDTEEIRIIGAHKANVVHNPNSNLKLGSGYKFMYQELRDAGANIAIGTDGCSSSNNLDILEATKNMALLQKGWRGDPTSMPADDAIEIATLNGFKSMGIDAGRIEVGALADLMLIDLNNIAFVPNHNTLSNLLYAAHNDSIDTVICNGKIVMEHRKVENEDKIISETRRVTKRLITVRP